jgi:hypothetical protein
MTGGTVRTDGAASALEAGLWGVVVWGVVLLADCDNRIISSRVGH